MQRRDFLRFSALLAATASPAARAQRSTYPNSPVTIVLPLQAASASDVAIRHLADRLGGRLNTSFIVENVAAAAGVVGLERLARARPDGYTLAALNNSIITILPQLQPRHVKVDTRKDFAPIAGIANIPTFFAVPSGSPIANVSDLLTAARENPGKLTYASGGIGSPQHLAAEMLLAYSEIKLTHVPYRGASQAALAVASSEVDFMPMALSLAKGFLDDKRVRLIAYCGTERHSQFPELATVQEQGVANYDYASWIALFVDANAPAPVLDLLRNEVQALVSDAGLQKQLTQSGLDPWPRSPDELAHIIATDYDRWGKVIRDANIPTT